MLISLPPTHSFAQENADEAEIKAFYTNVMGAISSQPRPTFPVEAEVLIAFRVADDGTIESINVARSSGSNPIDVVALDLVLNAAPFSTPPEGANQNLSITIQSRRPELSFGSLDR